MIIDERVLIEQAIARGEEPDRIAVKLNVPPAFVENVWQAMETANAVPDLANPTCRRGHALTSENTRIRHHSSGTDRKECLVCRRVAEQRRRAAS